MRTNPLELLGVPRVVLVREYNLRQTDVVLKVAQANYRNLSRLFHPDVEGGDAALMAELGDAISELGDRDALLYYMEELVEGADLAATRRRDVIESNQQQLEDRIRHLVPSLGFIDQFELLGISQPTTYVTEFASTRMVLDVESPTITRAKVLSEDIRELLGPEAGTGDIVFKKGVWSERVMKTPNARRSTWLLLNSFASQEVVRLVGCQPLQTFSLSDSTSVRIGLEKSMSQETINWESPVSAWFLAGMQPAMPESSHFAFIALKGNLVAQLGRCAASASM